MNAVLFSNNCSLFTIYVVLQDTCMNDVGTSIRMKRPSESQYFRILSFRGLINPGLQIYLWNKICHTKNYKLTKSAVN